MPKQGQISFFMLFITCFPSRFMRFGTSGYIMETAAAAAAIPSAMPVVKPNTFISVTFSFRKSLLSRDFRSVSATLSGGFILPGKAAGDTHSETVQKRIDQPFALKSSILSSCTNNRTYTNIILKTHAPVIETGALLWYNMNEKSGPIGRKGHVKNGKHSS